MPRPGLPQQVNERIGPFRITPSAQSKRGHVTRSRQEDGAGAPFYRGVRRDLSEEPFELGPEGSTGRRRATLPGKALHAAGTASAKALREERARVWEEQQRPVGSESRDDASGRGQGPGGSYRPRSHVGFQFKGDGRFRQGNVSRLLCEGRNRPIMDPLECGR